MKYPTNTISSYQQSLNDSVEVRKVCNYLVTLGKFGLGYLGIRAIGQFAGIGPEMNSKEPMILDALGVATSYVGGWSWLSAKILEHEEKMRGLERNFIIRRA